MVGQLGLGVGPLGVGVGAGAGVGVGVGAVPEHWDVVPGATDSALPYWEKPACGAHASAGDALLHGR